mgnify:CR=1 FL=1
MQNEAPRQPRLFSLHGRQPPQNGAASSLAGVAEPGDQCMVAQLGLFENTGTLAEPIWTPYAPERPHFYITETR